MLQKGFVDAGSRGAVARIIPNCHSEVYIKREGMEINCHHSQTMNGIIGPCCN